jgi:hypothetical protein
MAPGSPLEPTGTHPNGPEAQPANTEAPTAGAGGTAQRRTSLHFTSLPFPRRTGSRVIGRAVVVGLAVGLGERALVVALAALLAADEQRLAAGDTNGGAGAWVRFLRVGGMRARVCACVRVIGGEGGWADLSLYTSASDLGASSNGFCKRKPGHATDMQRAKGSMERCNAKPSRHATALMH